MSYNIPKTLKLFQVYGIDGTSTGSTLIGTTAASDTFVPISIIAQLTSTTGFVTAASISIGTNSSSYNNILAITALTGVNANNYILNIPITTAIASIAASTGMYVKVTTGATATTYVLSISIMGYYS